MPEAQIPRTLPPFPLTDKETAFIKSAVERFYGEDAIVRNFGPDPNRVQIHVETNREADDRNRYDCLGVLLCKIDRPIDLTVTKRGGRIGGFARVAYRQGVII